MDELIRAYIVALGERARRNRKQGDELRRQFPLTAEHLHGRAITYNVVAIELQTILNGGHDGTEV